MEKFGFGGLRNISKSIVYVSMVIFLELCCIEIGIFRSYVLRDIDLLLFKFIFLRCKREKFICIEKYLVEVCFFNKIKNK